MLRLGTTFSLFEPLAVLISTAFVWRFEAKLTSETDKALAAGIPLALLQKRV